MIGGSFANEPSDYVEELVDKEGNHLRKEVHQGPGFKTVEISSDKPISDDQIGSILQDLIMQ